jgi:hypothetical protein
MKRFILPASFLLFLSCSATNGGGDGAPALPAVWEVTEGVQSPESAYFDANSGLLFVSQIGAGGPTGKDGDGHISKLTPDGTVVAARWITDLNAPKGMRSSEGRLWVSDIDRLIGIDIEKGEIVEQIEVPDAEFLNDVACDGEGAVYVSDMSTGKIHRYQDGELSVHAEGDQLESPNGLLVDGKRLIVAAWGGETPGRLLSFDLASGAKTPITPEPLGTLDGVEAAGDGAFLVSDWTAGKIFRVTKDGRAKLVLQLPKGSADIGFLADRKLLIVPQMLENKVTAYRLAPSAGRTDPD